MSEKKTLKEVAVEAAEVTKEFEEKQNENRKNLFKNLTTIIPALTILLTITLFSYNMGYYYVYNVPIENIPLNLKSYLPLAISFICCSYYIVVYYAWLKTDIIMDRNHHSIERVLSLFFILCVFTSRFNFSKQSYKITALIISFIVPFILELAIIFIRKARKKYDKKLKKKIPGDSEELEKETIVFKRIRNSIFIKYGLPIIVLIVVIAPTIGTIKAKYKKDYQLCEYDNKTYVVIAADDDMFLIQSAFIDEEKNDLKIDISNYKFVSKDSSVLKYQNFNDVIIENGENSNA